MTSATHSRIAAINLVANPTLPKRILCAFIDHLMGVKDMDKLYQTHAMAGLDKHDFAQALLEVHSSRTPRVPPVP